MNAPKITGRVSESTITEDQLRLLMLTRAISPSTYLWATWAPHSIRIHEPAEDMARRNRDDARARAVKVWNERST